MNSVTLLIVVIVIVIVAAVLAVAFLLVPYLKKKNIPVAEYLNKAEIALQRVDSIFDTVKPFLPGGPTIELIDKILKWAQVGVDNAEQLYYIGEIEKTKRKDEARSYVLNALQIAGISITPELERVIDGAIEAGVLALGHKPAEALPKASVEN